MPGLTARQRQNTPRSKPFHLLPAGLARNLLELDGVGQFTTAQEIHHTSVAQSSTLKSIAPIDITSTVRERPPGRCRFRRPGDRGQPRRVTHPIREIPQSSTIGDDPGACRMAFPLSSSSAVEPLGDVDHGSVRSDRGIGCPFCGDRRGAADGPSEDRSVVSRDRQRRAGVEIPQEESTLPRTTNHRPCQSTGGTFPPGLTRIAPVSRGDRARSVSTHRRAIRSRSTRPDSGPSYSPFSSSALMRVRLCLNPFLPYRGINNQQTTPTNPPNTLNTPKDKREKLIAWSWGT